MSFSRVRIFLSLKNPEVLGSTASKPPKKDMPSTSFVIQSCIHYKKDRNKPYEINTNWHK